MMYAIDPTMSFAQVVQYYKDYVKRTKSYGRKPVEQYTIDHFVVFQCERTRNGSL